MQSRQIFFAKKTKIMIVRLDFINNQIEKRTGFDMNGDGYIGGEGRFLVISINSSIKLYSILGFQSKLERATHIDFNGDNRIGRQFDNFPGGGFPQQGGFNGGFPQQGGFNGGFPPQGGFNRPFY